MDEFRNDEKEPHHWLELRMGEWFAAKAAGWGLVAVVAILTLVWVAPWLH